MTRLHLAILVALSAGPLNGHATSRQIRWDNESTFIPSHQSVYQALTRLEQLKLVETASDRDKVLYQLTPKGHGELKREKLHLELTLRHLQSRL